MNLLRALSCIFWIGLMMIACNTTPEPSNTQDNAETSTVEGDQSDNKEANSLENESFPEGNGYKGRQGDFVFYVVVDADEISGFVRHKDTNEENIIEGKMSSPFDFDAEELLEDEDGELTQLAKLRGKMGDDGSSVELDYSDVNSATTFRLQLKK